MQLPLLLLSLVASSYAILGIGRTQSVAVTGRLICNGQPASNVKVKLYEKEATFDVKMDEGKTNQNGEFRLSGSKTEISTIDPKVNVYHKCNYNGPCYRKFGITIPDSYITRGANPQKTFDIGTINLANRFTGETTDCIN
ncbi:Transthyretin-like family protein [Teladorsagia circumcincta]|uniref:Transthyretin-like family protein n=1 Tax=Teladorsagia circumcincta TaxID=45464 RepID=A0A2G9UHX2_TELCI|nr:Transthyretin-like family protein [Teladorsagia circumcincta]